MASSNTNFQRRQQRTRRKLRTKAIDSGRARLSVYRSGRHIYAQVIDDRAGNTVASASSLEKDMRSKMPHGGNKDAASAVGKLLAERAIAAGITTVIFDRGGYLFHGRVKALADAAREGGLQF